MNEQAARDKITLDQAIAAVRDEDVPQAAAAAAAARVLETLTREPQLAVEPAAGIRGCADVQALLPAYRRGALQSARAVLVQDHLRECATCRASYRQPGVPRLALLPWRPATPELPSQRRDGLRWALAASVLLALGLAAFAARQAYFAAPTGSRASVQSLRGALQRVDGGGTTALGPGEQIGEGEVVRTARSSQALLRLRDGSIVELGERAELSVTARGQDTTIHLERGRIIVQAAKRRVGQLVVAARDCTVYVTGTVFSVNRGLKGSRVSVIEGQVRVVQGGAERNLMAGDQLATNPSMGRRPVRDEIAWSDNLDAHLAVLAELTELSKDLEAVRLPGLRYESRLLPLVPDQALVYASFPNYGAAFGEAYTLFERRLDESPALKEWWEQALPWRRAGPSLAQVIEKVRSFSDYLGDEIVFAALDDGRGRAWPLLLAEVHRPGLREYLEAELPGLGNDGPRVLILDEVGEEQLAAARAKGELPILLRPDLIGVAVDAGAFRALAERLRDGGPGLDQTSFGQRLAHSYRDGASVLFGADLERIALAADRTGSVKGLPLPPAVEGIRHLIVELEETAGQAQAHAELTFAGRRHGIASWLGAPAPMGSLEFVSSSASAVGSFVVNSPALLLDDLLAAAGEGGVRRELAELEARVKLSFREDVAATLGGEFTVALDGPLLPTPALEVIAEVYDPTRLQSAIQSLVNAWNEDARREQRSEIRLVAEQVDVRTYYALRRSDASFPLEVHYAFVDGYLVAAGSRALVMRAIQIREGGNTLPQSAGFRSLFPADDRTNVSALLYQNLGSLLTGMVRTPGVAGLRPGQRDAVAALARQSPPILLYAYGEDDRIQVAGMGGLVDLGPSSAALPALIERLIPAAPARGVQ
jgi:ferric-dicitrate binding protein FerR (iron transport regulator)